MAPSKSLCCSLAVCLWALGFAQELHDAEIFPLSGGVENGMNVRIVAEGYSGQQAIMDFMTPTRKVALRWNLQGQVKTITRSSPDYGGANELWGTSAVDGTERVTFDFVKTKHYWATWINNRRTNWFDFLHRTNDPITHLAVYPGVQVEEIVQTRPTCTTPCWPTECLNSTGGTTCQDETCYSVIPSDSSPAYSSSCSAAQTTSGDPGTHCCEGRPPSMNHFALSENVTWARMLEDTEHLRDACEAFQLDAEKCVSLSATNVRISSIDSSARTVRVWSPVLFEMNPNDEDATLTVPVFGGFIKPPENRFLNFSKVEMKEITVDSVHGFVSRLGTVPTDRIPRYSFVNMMTSLNGLVRWFAYQPDRWFFERDMQPFPWIFLRISDQEIDTTACVDDTDWVDANGATCDDYTASQWCNVRGRPTDTWLNLYPGTDLFVAKNATGWAAPWTCCFCGGGYHEIPDEVPEAGRPENIIFE